MIHYYRTGHRKHPITADDGILPPVPFGPDDDSGHSITAGSYYELVVIGFKAITAGS